MGRRKREAEAAQAAAIHTALERSSAWHDGRQLALEIAGYERAPGTVHYDFGLSLDAGEHAYRSFWCGWQLRSEVRPDFPDLANSTPPTSVFWPAPVAVQCLLTDQQIAFRYTDGQLVQIYWSALAGVSVNLDAERLHLDYVDGRAGAFLGTPAPVLAVGAIAGVYGVDALLEHPAIESLRTIVGDIPRTEYDVTVTVGREDRSSPPAGSIDR